METVWVVERVVFPETAARCVDAVHRAGGRIVEYADGMDEAALPPPGTDAVFYGSLGVGQRLAARGWRPGVICNTAALHCSVYQPRLAGLLLNEPAVFTTAADLVADPHAVARALGATEGRVFVRPDSPLKPFSGRVVSVEGLSLRALDHGFYYDDAALPVVVSAVQTVEAEWRFVVVRGSVVAETGYVAEGRRAEAGVVPGEARAVAEQVAALDWSPDPAFVVDVCRSPELGYRVLELNSLSGSDLYGCDFEAVVRAISTG